VLDAEGGLVLGRKTRSLRVEHTHLEGACPASDRPADASEPDDPQRGAADVVAHELLLRPTTPPAAGSDVAVALHYPPPNGEDQREREVGRRSIDRARRVGDSDAAGSGRVDIDELVARSVVGHQPKGRKELEQGFVDRPCDHGERLHARPHLGERPLEVLDVPELVPGGPGKPPGRQDPHGFKAILSTPRWR
jgi:hypothetical protein